MTNAALQIENLRVDFPEIVAVDGLNLAVMPGEVCGLIGPNGAGKTTTMRAIAGLQEPTRGQILISGRDVHREATACRHRVGFMPDHCPLYDGLTVAQYLDHFGRAHRLPRRGERVRQCIELAWLTEKADAECRELSRGMKQRVLLARTLLHDPAVVVLDEPASGIDPLGRIELRKLIVGLRDAGKAVLVSSHILSEMDQFCTSVAIMERGRLVQNGTIERLTQGSTSRRMAAAWRVGHPSPAEFLRARRDLASLEIRDNTAIFEFSGSDDAIDAMLAEWLSAGVRVTEWRRTDLNLEQILLDSGANQVS